MQECLTGTLYCPAAEVSCLECSLPCRAPAPLCAKLWTHHDRPIWASVPPLFHCCLFRHLQCQKSASVNVPRGLKKAYSSLGQFTAGLATARGSLEHGLLQPIVVYKQGLQRPRPVNWRICSSSERLQQGLQQLREVAAGFTIAQGLLQQGL